MVTLTDHAIPGLLHYVRKKVRWGPEGAPFSTKSFHLTRVIHFNWLAKSNWWGPGLLVVNIIGNYCCTLVLLKEKMLKETENEKAQIFCNIFIIGGILIGVGPGPPPSHRRLHAYDCNFNAICDIKILCVFLAVCPCVHVKATLLVLFCVIMLNMWYHR